MPKILVKQQTIVPVNVGKQGPAGPPGPSATPYQPATQAEMEAGVEAAMRSMSPQLVAQAIAALAGGGGGGAGMWETVLQQSPAGNVQEIAWTGLDLSKYVYRITGRIEIVGNNGQALRWYATESSLGSVNPANYKCRIFSARDIFYAITNNDNRFFYTHASYYPGYVLVEAFLWASADGHTVLSCRGFEQTANDSLGVLFGLESFNTTVLIPANKISVYNSAGAYMGPGTSLTMERMLL